MTGGQDDASEQTPPPVRPDRQERGRIGFAVFLGTALSVAAVAVVMWNRAQLQVSIRVIDACTVGAPPAAGVGGTCDAQHDIRSPMANPNAGNSGDGQARGRHPAPREEKSDDGFTTFVF